MINIARKLTKSFNSVILVALYSVYIVMFILSCSIDILLIDLFAIKHNLPFVRLPHYDMFRVMETAQYFEKFEYCSI